MHRSVRLRATLLATATVALALAVTAAVLVWILKGSLEASVDEDAQRRLEAATLVAADAAGPTQPLPTWVAAKRVTAPAAGESLDVIVGSAEPPPGWSSGYKVAAAEISTTRGVVAVQARSSLEPVRAALDALRPMLFIGVPCLLLIVAVLTWLLVGRALAPVSAIRAKFTEITASDLHQRVPVPPTRDEVARLARAMNATLDRLEAAVQQHRRFVADAAHELRSPLATLRTRLELGRRAAPGLASEALADVGRIQGLAADLLFLARLDAGEPLRLDEVDLAQAAAEVAADTSLRTRSGDVRVLLDVAPDVVVNGSRAHLGRMIGNLVDNAVRHAASTVTVRVRAPGILEVVDDGPGIPAEHRESVFDRFTRLDEARARDAGGAGLGLAIARDIARAHGGTLVATTPDGGTRTGPGGACLRARLPAAAAPPPSGRRELAAV